MSERQHQLANLEEALVELLEAIENQGGTTTWEKRQARLRVLRGARHYARAIDNLARACSSSRLTRPK